MLPGSTEVRITDQRPSAFDLTRTGRVAHPLRSRSGRCNPHRSLLYRHRPPRVSGSDGRERFPVQPAGRSASISRQPPSDAQRRTGCFRSTVLDSQRPRRLKYVKSRRLCVHWVDVPLAICSHRQKRCQDQRDSNTVAMCDSCNGSGYTGDAWRTCQHARTTDHHSGQSGQHQHRRRSFACCEWPFEARRTSCEFADSCCACNLATGSGEGEEGGNDGRTLLDIARCIALGIEGLASWLAHSSRDWIWTVTSAAAANSSANACGQAMYIGFENRAGSVPRALDAQIEAQ